MKKVFVSYAWKDNAKDEVGALVRWLNEQEGIEVVSDHLHLDAPPPQGWEMWMLHSIENADIVLCVCGEAYKKGVEKRDGGGRGVTWEGAIITIDLYENRGWNEKYYPILLGAGGHQFVPKPLRSWDNNITLAEREKILRLIRYERAGETQVFPDTSPCTSDNRFVVSFFLLKSVAVLAMIVIPIAITLYLNSGRDAEVIINEEPTATALPSVRIVQSESDNPQVCIGDGCVVIGRFLSEEDIERIAVRVVELFQENIRKHPSLDAKTLHLLELSNKSANSGKFEESRDYLEQAVREETEVSMRRRFNRAQEMRRSFNRAKNATGHKRFDARFDAAAIDHRLSILLAANSYIQAKAVGTRTAHAAELLEEADKTLDHVIRSVVYINNNRPLEEADKTLDHVIRSLVYINNNRPLAQELIPMVLLLKGVILLEQGKTEDAIAIFGDIDSRFGEDDSPSLREWVAKALSQS